MHDSDQPASALYLHHVEIIPSTAVPASLERDRRIGTTNIYSGRRVGSNSAMAAKRSKRAKFPKDKRGNEMAEPKMDNSDEVKQSAASGAPVPPASQSVNLQLVPANDSDQPIFANVTVVQPTAGVTLLDFGFLDPGAMAALTNIARAGMKIPERINGRLTVRIAMSYDALAALQQQIGGVMQAVRRQVQAQSAARE